MATSNPSRSIRQHNDFKNTKNQCLGKRDKSFAGRIDVKAVDICSVINAREEYYTTSSCAGRCFLYKGQGTKSQHDVGIDTFKRFRISHHLILEGQATRYFDLSTLNDDPTGGADPVRSIGQYEHAEKLREITTCKCDDTNNDNAAEAPKKGGEEPAEEPVDVVIKQERTDQTTWLRFEPFILHVNCRSLSAASALMAAARPAFKNVGLTAWKDTKYLVAVWGDEGLDMPLCTPSGAPLYNGLQEWLKEMVNERHERNWTKIDRFVQAIRKMPILFEETDDTETYNQAGGDQSGESSSSADNNVVIPKSFDVIGDIALLNTLPTGGDAALKLIGTQIMKKNKAIKVCAVRTTALTGTERSPGEAGIKIIAGARRSPLVTSHTEYGIKCVVDLNHTFFSPRMGPERLRICQQVARGEHVLVLFAGVAMDAMQIAGRTEARSVVAVELNPNAVECARRAHRMLERNKAVKCVGAAERIQIIEGNVMEIMPTLKKGSFDRILAPRPKEGSMDGDLGKGDGGVEFLEVLLPLLREEGGECHWYDFAADHELPTCERTCDTVSGICDKMGLSMEVVHLARVGSIAKRQHRVCLDFRLTGKKI